MGCLVGDDFLKHVFTRLLHSNSGSCLIQSNTHAPNNLLCSSSRHHVLLTTDFSSIIENLAASKSVLKQYQKVEIFLYRVDAINFKSCLFFCSFPYKTVACVNILNGLGQIQKRSRKVPGPTKSEFGMFPQPRTSQHALINFKNTLFCNQSAYSCKYQSYLTV